MLKSKLVGETFREIHQLPCTESNYKIAWNIVRNRFHNKRLLVNAALYRFMNQPTIESPTRESLRSLIDTSKSALQCVESLQIDIDTWDPIIVLIITSKLDVQTLTKWETYLKGAAELSKYSDMLEFLNTEFNVLESLSQRAPAYIAQPATSNVPKKEYRKKACPLCGGPHWLFVCNEFDGYSVDRRIKFVKNNNLCQICLHHHPNEECKSKYRYLYAKSVREIITPNYIKIMILI